jgi:large subunit ribosomal protein L9
VKVLFLKEVQGTAKAGDVKEVSPGYARNFLFPQKLAVVADDKVVDQIRQREDATRRRAEKALTEAREIERRLQRITVTMYAKAGEGGRLFGSVTNADIAQQLKREAGIDLDKRKIDVDPAIKSLGPHEVIVQLHSDVTATLRVVVAAQ